MIYDDDYKFFVLDYGKSRSLFEDLQLIGSEILRIKAIPKKKIKEREREAQLEDLYQRENYAILGIAKFRGLLFFSRN